MSGSDNHSPQPITKLEDHHLELMEEIYWSHQFGYMRNQQRLAKQLDKSQSAVSQTLQDLKSISFVKTEKTGSSKIPILTEIGERHLRTPRDQTEMLDRAHKIVFHFDLPGIPEGLGDHPSICMNEGPRHWNQRICQGDAGGPTILFNGSSSVSVFIGETWAQEPRDAILFAYKQAEAALMDVMSDFPNMPLESVVHEKGRMYPCSVSKQHHALGSHPVADKAIEFDIKLTSSSDHFFDIDESDGAEIEFTQPRKSHYHMRFLMQFFQSEQSYLLFLNLLHYSLRPIAEDLWSSPGSITDFSYSDIEPMYRNRNMESFAM